MYDDDCFKLLKKEAAGGYSGDISKTKTSEIYRI